jgi:hypothetical protein
MDIAQRSAKNRQVLQQAKAMAEAGEVVTDAALLERVVRRRTMAAVCGGRVEFSKAFSLHLY